MLPNILSLWEVLVTTPSGIENRSADPAVSMVEKDARKKDAVIANGEIDGDNTYVTNGNDNNTGIIYFDFRLIAKTFDIPSFYACFNHGRVFIVLFGTRHKFSKGVGKVIFYRPA